MPAESLKLDCGHTIQKQSDSITTGYGRDEHNRTLCYACCADKDREYMRTHNRISLYFADGEVANWPGSLKFKPTLIRHGSHNIAGTRTDVWFTGPDDSRWHGVQFGRWSQICRCKRLKD